MVFCNREREAGRRGGTENVNLYQGLAQQCKLYWGRLGLIENGFTPTWHASPEVGGKLCPSSPEQDVRRSEASGHITQEGTIPPFLQWSQDGWVERCMRCILYHARRSTASLGAYFPASWVYHGSILEYTNTKVLLSLGWDSLAPGGGGDWGGGICPLGIFPVGNPSLAGRLWGRRRVLKEKVM